MAGVKLNLEEHHQAGDKFIGQGQETAECSAGAAFNADGDGTPFFAGVGRG